MPNTISMQTMIVTLKTIVFGLAPTVRIFATPGGWLAHLTHLTARRCTNYPLVIKGDNWKSTI